MRNQRGLVLMEVVVATAILGILVFGWITFEANTQKEIQKTITRSKVQKILLVIQSDILKDDRFLPPTDVIAAIDEAGFSDAALEKTFEDSEFVQKRCYTDGGARLDDLGSPDCYFYVWFYKMRVRDRGYPVTSKLSYIPLNRINIRVTYKQRGHGVGESEQDMVRYFSRLSTQTAAY